MEIFFLAVRVITYNLHEPDKTLKLLKWNFNKWKVLGWINNKDLVTELVPFKTRVSSNVCTHH